MQGLKIGHYTNNTLGTGLSVFLFDHPSAAAYCLCGSAPATRDLHTLELDASVGYINALVFTGGSAFGLGSIDGVMQWLKEHDQGYKTAFGVVPIVPAAAIYDLGVQSSSPPTSENAYQACKNATENNNLQKCIGAGTGATIGKIVPHANNMRGGFGWAEIKLPDGLIVEAFAVVNCVGDVIDNQNNIIAGALNSNNKFANCAQYLLSGQKEAYLASDNTTLVAIFTNAKFSKIELKRIAKMAVAGMARAISPIFTPYDGDLIFCVSLGEETASEISVGTIAAEAVRQAIVNAVH